MGLRHSRSNGEPFFGGWRSILRFVSPCSLLLAILVLSSLATFSFGQARRSNLGKEFYITYPANFGTDENHTLMGLYLTSRTPAHGVVTVPGLSYTKAFTTTPGQITTIILPGDPNTGTVEITQSEMIFQGMAVHIVADTDVAVYGVDHKLYSSDAFMGLPTNVLGTEYRAMCYPTSVNGGSFSELTPGEFVVIGTQDSTHITITPVAKTDQGKPANVPFTIILNSGDVYMVQGDGLDGSNDLTGSLIESDLPIAVFSGHKRTELPQGTLNETQNGTSRNNLVEQMPPVSAWGDSALVIPYATSVKPDLVRIISAEDNNQIRVNGALVATLNAGAFYEITALSGVTSINATNPILVGQYMHTSWGGKVPPDPNPDSYGDPCLAIDFPVEQFDTEYTIISVQNGAFTGNFVNLVVPTSAIGSMTVDGVVVASAGFTAIPASIYEYAQVRLKQGTHNLHCLQPFGATVYALGLADAYAYTGGSQIKTITPLKTVDLVIDFGDRLLKPVTLAGKFDTTVPITNISSDPVEIYGYPRRTGDTTKFYVTTPTPSQATPEIVKSGGTDSITIEFQPLEVGRRMHTQLIAKTVHLRAYVVDLYGRGVLDGLASFSDSLSAHAVDTVDFGTFAATDPPKDTTIYLSNPGYTTTQVTSASVSGGDAPYFQQLTSQPPFSIDTGKGHFEPVTLQFTPSTPPATNGLKVAQFNAASQNGFNTQVVLLARIETISAPTLNSPTFDTLLSCNNEVKSIQIQNPDDKTMTLDSVVVVGPNAADFTLSTQFPMPIAPSSNGQVNIGFQPGGDGLRTAKLILYFDLPKGTVDTVSVAGYGTHSNIVFAADTNVHILSGESFSIDVRALTDLTPFKAKGYTIQLTYDSTYVGFQNTIQDNTHSYFGYFIPTGIPGHELLTYQAIPDSVIWGGGVTDSIPLIVLQFASTPNGADPTNFHQVVDIGINVQLLNTVLQGPCITSNSGDGSVVIDSSCSSPGVIVVTGVPLLAGMEQPNPNPFTYTTSIQYELPHSCQARIVVSDVLGRPLSELVNEWKKPGYYTAHFDGSGLNSGMLFVTLYADGFVKTRSMMLTK